MNKIVMLLHSLMLLNLSVLNVAQWKQKIVQNTASNLFHLNADFVAILVCGSAGEVPISVMIAINDS